MDESNNEQVIDTLEEPPTDFKSEIQEIYNELPQSVQAEYKERLRKHGHENDYETEGSYNILKRLSEAYDRKRERSRKNSQKKREETKLLQQTLNIKPRTRGRPKKVTPVVAEPKEEPIKTPENLPEPLDIPPIIAHDDDDESDDEEEPFKMDDINELMESVKIEAKKEVPKTPPLPPPPRLKRNSLNGLFNL